MIVSSMDKMWLSFIAIGLMIAASLIVMFTRAKFGRRPVPAGVAENGKPAYIKESFTRRLIRYVLLLISGILLFYGIIFMFVSLV